MIAVGGGQCPKLSLDHMEKKGQIRCAAPMKSAFQSIHPKPNIAGIVGPNFRPKKLGRKTEGSAMLSASPEASALCVYPTALRASSCWRQRRLLLPYATCFWNTSNI